MIGTRIIVRLPTGEEKTYESQNAAARDLDIPTSLINRRLYGIKKETDLVDITVRYEDGLSPNLNRRIKYFGIKQNGELVAVVHNASEFLAWIVSVSKYFDKVPTLKTAYRLLTTCKGFRDYTIERLGIEEGLQNEEKLKRTKD